MRGGKTKNIMDQMMEMMEKYANNLEEIVTDRTRMLCEEKRKTEDLLHRMLPRTVAEKLTMGQGVEPVSYDLVRERNAVINTSNVFTTFNEKNLFSFRSLSILAILWASPLCQRRVHHCKW